ncbi:hypothetical protein BJ878DRAFT_502883 [Calycina marina]|uniref:Uncharacterized protein n=1 Tax=Calycina marina TaxID=1763456 RepID=A0A9P7Z3X6_9HELO|nr:hypothetical protein BJ878DRAFT_502883 [Calycina marina]
MSARQEMRFFPSVTIEPPVSVPIRHLFEERDSNDSNSDKLPLEENTRSIPAQKQRPKSTPWSSRPNLLRDKLRFHWWTDVVIDVFVIILSIPFFAIAGAVIALSGRDANDNVLVFLQQIIKGAATLFPIFFAYVTGRATVKLATWKLEKGSSLGLLEQLMGSRTVTSSITTQIHLRRYNLMGLGLIVLWSLSPIGSQAILYILDAPLKPVTSTVNVSYINLRQQSYAAPDGIFKGSWFSGFTMLFGSSLLAPTAVRSSSMDLWGNVKIPCQSSLLIPGASTNSDEWIQIAEDASPTYSSLLGVPLSGILPGNTTVNIESSYIRLNCTSQTLINSNISPDIPATISKDNPRLLSTLISPAGPFLGAENVTFETSWIVGYQGPDLSAFNSSIYKSSLPWSVPQSCPDCLAVDIYADVDPGTLLYQEFDGLENATNVFCTPSTVYVESAVTCENIDGSQTCKVTAQRLSQLPNAPEAITYLSFREVALGVSALLPKLSPLADNNPAQNYLYDPTSSDSIMNGATSNMGIFQTPLAAGQVSLADFGDRLGQLLNTFIFASMWNTTAYTIGAPFSGIIDVPLGGHAASFTPADSDAVAAMIKNQTAAFTVPAVVIQQVRIYKVSYEWAAVFLFATSAMLFSACSGVYFSRHTVVPDYLGYVSSLAKESPYVRMPTGGANLDGMDRARLMKDLRVRLGNVDEGKGQIGKLAFARMEETGLASKDGFYV